MVGRMNTKTNLQDGESVAILCKIAVGKAFVISHEDYLEQTAGAAQGGKNISNIEIPKGYDSVLIEAPKDAMESIYEYRYIISNKYQVLPQVIAKFKMNIGDQTYEDVCCKCGEHPQLYCVNDDALFCNECDSEFHD